MIERFAAEMRQGLDDAAACIEQQVTFVGDDDRKVAPLADMYLDEIGKIVDVDDGRLDVGLGQAVEYPGRSGCGQALPTSGFGVVAVIGRMRLPRPAASTMARRG